MADRAIHIRSCIFGGRYVVTVEPRTVDQPSTEHSSFDRAVVAAVSLSAKTKWPIINETGEDAHG